jgi:hypothetical protein
MCVYAYILHACIYMTIYLNIYTHTCVQIRTAIASINATARVIVSDPARYPTWQELMDVARDKSHDHRECGVCEDELDDGM